MVSSPDDFKKFIAAEIEKWGKVVKFAEYKTGMNSNVAGGKR